MQTSHVIENQKNLKPKGSAAHAELPTHVKQLLQDSYVIC